MSKRLSISAETQEDNTLSDQDPTWLDFRNKHEQLRRRLEQDPAWSENNLEYDLRSTDWMLEKVRSSDVYAQCLYAALCNNEFRRNDTWPILTDQRWSCTWRYAGGIIADMQQKGDYIDWYCSGIRGTDSEDEKLKGYVPESHVTDEIRADLFRLGWSVIE